MTEPSAVPELRHRGGFRGGHRIYTRDHVTFDTLYEKAPLIALGDYCIAYVSSTDRPGYRLSAFKIPVIWTLGVQPEKHELDGTVYGTRDDARRAAFEAGLTAFMVYEENKR